MMTISLCMITKNEEKHLANCLNSVKGLVDEIIVVDTGSTDRTKEIAKSFGAKVHEFKWINDFSAARNESLKHATKGWILILDADESIAQQDHDNIRRLITEAKGNIAGFALLQRNYTNDAHLPGWTSSTGDAYEESKIAAGFCEVPTTRLFRNNSGGKFVGKVHENLHDSLMTQGKIPLVQVLIHHVGKLDAQVNLRKAEFYEKLAEEKAQEEDSFTSYYELGQEKLTLRKISEAVTAFEESIKRNPTFYESWFSLGSCYYNQERFAKSLEAYQKAQKLNSKDPAVYSALGVLYFKQERYNRASTYFLNAVTLNPKDAQSYFNLGVCFSRVGKERQAHAALTKAVELNPSFKEYVELE